MTPNSQSDDTVPELPSDFGRHNMFAFGRENLYLSHLPMFMEPHDAQLILEVTHDKPDGSLQEIWSEERKNHPDQRLYTMMPEEFALSTLYSPNPPARDEFTATFFRGHLERGGEPIPELTGINVRIGDVIYANRFGQTPRPDDLTYLLVGRANEFFLVHIISQPPDFDQIISVQMAGEIPNDDELKQASVSVVFMGRANSAGARLQAETTATARAHVTGAHQFLTIEFTVINELYFEEGELATSRGIFAPTPLETEAGFGK